MANYQPKRKRGRPHMITGVPHNNNHLSDLEAATSDKLLQGGPTELLETRMDKDQSSPHSPSSYDQTLTSKSPDDEDSPLRHVKLDDEPTAGPSGHDPSQGYSNSQDSDGVGGVSVIGGNYSSEHQSTTHWGAHFLTSDEVIIPAALKHRSTVIIRAQGAFDGKLVKQEDTSDELHENPLTKHELLEYVIQHDGSVICKWCGDILPSRTHWYRHKYRVHAVNLYKCIRCNMFFKTKKGYIGHISHRHGETEDDIINGVNFEDNDENKYPSIYDTDSKNNNDCDDDDDDDILNDSDLMETEPIVTVTTSPSPSPPPQAQPLLRSSVVKDNNNITIAPVVHDSEWELERQREERLVAEIIARVRKECEAQGGTSTISRRRYSRRSTVMNSS